MQERAIKEDYWYANNLFLSGKYDIQHKITGSLNTWWFWCRDDLRNQQSQPLCSADDQVVGNEIKIEDDTVQWRDQDKVEGSSTTTEVVCAISCRVGTRGRELNFDTSRLHCNGENQFLAASDSSVCIFVINQHQKTRFIELWQHSQFLRYFCSWAGQTWYLSKILYFRILNQMFYTVKVRNLWHCSLTTA